MTRRPAILVALFTIAFPVAPFLAQAQESISFDQSGLQPVKSVPRQADPLLDRVEWTQAETLASAREDWRVAVDVGLPTGLRVQRRIFDSNFWLEGGVGVWWFVPYASTCLRYDWAFIQRERNSFAMRPGLSTTLIAFGPFLGVGVDNEIVWTHRYGDRFRSELGIRVGVTAVVNHHRHDYGSFAAPVLSLVFNLAF